MVNSEELIGTTEYLTMQARCRINRCRYNRVPLYLYLYLLACVCESASGNYALLQRQLSVKMNYHNNMATAWCVFYCTRQLTYFASV
jgi:hypothetical protein